MFTDLPISIKYLAPLVSSVLLIVVLLAISKVPVGYNIRNLVVRWWTTLLTGLAFTLVVALLTVMLAFVNGMHELTVHSGQPGNVMILSDGATDELMSNLTAGDSGDIELQPGILRDEKGKAWCSRETYIVVNQPIAQAAGELPRRRFVQIRGIEDTSQSQRVHDVELLPGSEWFSSVGVQAVTVPDSTEPVQAIQAVIGEGVATLLGQDRGKPRLVVGDVFDLGPRKWVVVGIMRSEGSTFGSEIWAKRGVVGPIFGKQNYTTLVVRAADTSAAKALATFFTKSYKTKAVYAQTELEYFAKLSQTNEQFLMAIIFVAAIMAVGGVFGILNTMFAAVSQRTKDIGVLRIIGFGRGQILLSFFLESLLIALVGGLLGCGLGSLAHGVTASSIISSGPGGGKFVVLRLIIDADTLAAGLLFTLVMGAIGGIFPALTAMRLKPLESLR